MTAEEPVDLLQALLDSLPERHGAALDAVPAAGTTGDPDYPDVSGGGVPHLPVTPPPHPIG